MSHMTVSYKTPYGELKIYWEKIGGEILYNLHVPAAMTVVLYAPDFNVKELGGGDYVFRWNL